MKYVYYSVGAEFGGVMPGLLGVISNHRSLNEFSIDHLSLAPFNRQKKAYDNLRFERFTNKKFLDDKVFFEDNDLLVGIEGIIFNYSHLRSQHNVDSNFSLIKKLYSLDEGNFFNEFRGEFSGFVYDKTRNSITIFTNHTASKPLFYYSDDDTFVFASEVKVVSQLLNKLGKSANLNESGAYFLLSYGFMIHDHTLVKEVKKLLPGHCLKIQISNESDGSISFKHQLLQYFRFDNEQETLDDKNAIIEKVDELFKSSVTQEYQKDLEYGYNHIATLSGGLDSRMSVLMANKLGFKNITTMTFSESDYWDERIAKQIAHDNQFEFVFMSLDNGNYLKNLDPAVVSNDGNVLFAGAAHHLRMTGMINHQRFGLQHTGMLGDAIFGTYIGNPPNQSIKIGDGAYSTRLITKIEKDFNEIVKKYENAELFKLYNRGFNGIFNGYWMTQQYTEFSSAFLNVDLLNYTLSIPSKYKQHEQIYIDWIRTKHRDIGKYKWEHSLTSINMWPPLYKFVKFSKRAMRSLKRRLHLSRLYSMNPFESWYANNQSLRNFFKDQYEHNIHNLDSYKELQKDCKSQFEDGSTIQKSQVLTLLRAFDMLNLS